MESDSAEPAPESVAADAPAEASLRRRSISRHGLIVFAALLVLVSGWAIRSVLWRNARQAVLTNPNIEAAMGEDSIFRPPMAPQGMWIFGERGKGSLRLSTKEMTADEIREVRNLFPEAMLLLRSGEIVSDDDLDVPPGENLPANFAHK